MNEASTKHSPSLSKARSLIRRKRSGARSHNPHLIEEWLMKNDFKPVVGHGFNLRADWGVVDCKVLAVEPNKTLTYTWDSKGLESVVTWTLTPTSSGTRLRMEQSGFRPDQQQYHQGAKGGWPRFFAALEEVLARLD
jgi:uncharacterized protein YndB with AHSA1/START domain